MAGRHRRPRGKIESEGPARTAVSGNWWSPINWVVRPRQGGKSYACIDWVAQDPNKRVVVSYNRLAAEILRANAEKRYPGVTSRSNFAFAAEGWRTRGFKEVAVDDASLVLSTEFGNVVMVTDTH